MTDFNHLFLQNKKVRFCETSSKLHGKKTSSKNHSQLLARVNGNLYQLSTY